MIEEPCDMGMGEDPHAKTAKAIAEAFMRFRRIGWERASIAGLQPGEFKVLFAVEGISRRTGKDPKVSDISDLLSVASPTITQQVTRLEQDGFLIRVKDPHDQRVVRIQVTDSGRTQAQATRSAMIENLMGLAEYLGDDAGQELARLLNKTTAYFQERRTPHDQHV